MLKKISLVVAIILFAGIVYAVYLWNKPARNVLDEKNFIAVSAATIYKQYTTDENKANKMYLDSAIQVTGEVQEVKTNADGKRVLYLKTGDAMGTVSCTLKQQATIPTEKTVTIRGVCTGFNSIDVVIIESFQIK